MAGDWESFFVAQVGASAALTGLVFVALSINLSRIMQYKDLVDRAAEAVILLVTPALVGLAALTPYSRVTTGVIALVIAFTAWAFVTRIVFVSRIDARRRPRTLYVRRLVLAESATLPAVAGAIVLLAGADGYGLFALGAGLSVIAGIGDAWVLLVEILR